MSFHFKMIRILGRDPGRLVAGLGQEVGTGGSHGVVADGLDLLETARTQHDKF